MSAQIKVAVLGAAGRMGSEAVKAVTEAADMELVASLGRGDDLSQILQAGATHIVDLSVPASTEDNVRFAVEHGLHAVTLRAAAHEISKETQGIRFNPA